ncbi:ROK family transcriptional regulator [Nocardioides sp. zg-1308]|uniref:ROK family transcriptional regulator n=1 Tax=Nocardioides renjunii TaxID=3095075 RepID=A0ABU5KIA5_9ACTN|nr:ROK family transcriptional regulator [Nocardioides sp. S-58]MDZ5664194.1 ROK family transcriptional regulator [Nocardioides sp. S-58]NPD05367.1 ROK family transcriptional regulator [Nocardioides sp. zg-1308]
MLRALRRHGPATRAELAKHTGLAKATVGVIVADLEAKGAVAEEDARSGARGRPGRPVGLRGDRFVALGLELNVDYVSAVVVDLAGDVLHSEVRPAPTGAALLDLARDVVRRHTGPERPTVGATLAVPALVRGDDRTVAWAPNLAVEGAGLADALGRLLPGVRVQVSNDANCAAYAESHHGAARGAAHALYLTGTVGIGAGIVQDGEVMRGGAGFAGEVGHMPVGDSSAPCGCGRRGCWEASIGLHAMLAAVGMPELDTPLRTAESVAARARTDAGVRAGLERVGRDVGLGIAMLSSVLDPEVVVMGGYFAPLGDLVLEPARRTLDERLASEVQVRPDLRPSTLGIRAAALGAAEQSFDAVFAGDAELPG